MSLNRTRNLVAHCFNQLRHRVPQKIKFTVEEAMKIYRGVAVYLYSFFNLGARCCGCSTSRLGRCTPGKETRYPLYRRLGGPQGRSGRVRKILPSPPLFGPWTSSPQRVAIPTELYRPTLARWSFAFRISLESKGVIGLRSCQRKRFSLHHHFQIGSEDHPS